MRYQQAELFFYFVIFGVSCGLAYDWLRAARRELRQGTASTVMGDVVFAAAACIGFYGIFLKMNQGALRAYGFIGAMAGALLYDLTISRWIIRFYRAVLCVLLFPFRWFRRQCKKWKLGRKALTNRKG